MSSKGMIVAPQPEAVEAGARVLKKGGNAVDAAMACALVQGVVDPQMAGIAGFGSLQLYLPGEGEHYCIDFHGRSPAAVKADMWEGLIEAEAPDGFGFVLKNNVNDLGYQSITVPGSLKAYYEAQTRHGVMEWADVVAPAIAWADKGFTVRPQVYEFWSRDDSSGRVRVRDRLAYTASGRKLYFSADGDLKRPGQIVSNPDMAATLREIARDGADVFYQGTIGACIAEDMAANGGLLTLEDLRQYSTVKVDPLWGEYRGQRYATNNPPGGGIMLVEMLNVLENFDLGAMGHNTREYIRVVTEVMKRATSDKDNHVGDPAFFDVPVAHLTDKNYAAEMASAIRSGKKASVERFQAAKESANTTHVAVVDSMGNAVSMTHSLGMPSGVITEGLGFMYNGCMAVFDPRPGRADSLAPGKSRFSSLCPTIVFNGDTPHIVIGAPGGTQIAMGVLQSILNVLDFKMDMQQAVSAPRFSATSNVIDVANRIPAYITDELVSLGYEVRRSYLSFAFAMVHGIQIRDGAMNGGADPAGDGMSLSV
ncbi:MAG: gamma-glutamyltransferase [bacterium]|nr:gamma-glutamyltransferase [Gammaproteobacteria bacterium]HIL99233.1 gamma-glutamyltransferase [Pseudomonadales bacterium]